MIFENADGVTYALKKDAEYKGKIHQELLFAEIMEKKGMIKGQDATFFEVRWEDDWFNNVGTFETIDGAKSFVLDNYTSHTPISNGTSYDA